MPSNQKENNNKKKGRRGKDEPEVLDPSVYPTLVFLSDVDPETIVSRMMHKFCHAGGFYFWKKQLQYVETVTPFIIFYLYTFNNIAALCVELTDLLKKAHAELECNFMLPEEFQYSLIPEINIRRGVPKLPGQPGSQFRNYLREMQKARQAHLIECDVQVTPFLLLLLNHVKDRRLTAPVWGGACAHHGDGQLELPEGRRQPLRKDGPRPHVLQHECSQRRGSWDHGLRCIGGSDLPSVRGHSWAFIPEGDTDEIS
jgi:hypothetical protein